jgi:hypothetical protein
MTLREFPSDTFESVQSTVIEVEEHIVPTVGTSVLNPRGKRPFSIVIADRGGLEDESSPMIVEPIRQLDVLCSAESFVETACRQKKLSSYRSVAGVKLSVSRLAFALSEGVVLLVEHRLLPAYIGVRIVVGWCQHGSDYHHIAVSLVMSCQVLLDEICSGHDVVVNEEEKVTCCQADPSVACRCGAGVRPGIDQEPERRRSLSKEVIRSVRRSVRDDDDFKLTRANRLVREGMKNPAEAVHAVVGRDDDANFCSFWHFTDKL